MNKIFGIISFIGILWSFSATAGEEYTRCLDLNYKTDEGLVKCANLETERLMTKLDERYNIIAHHKFFRFWKNHDHSFEDLKQAWLKYRDDFCHLEGFSLTHAGDASGFVAEARCKLKETQRFRDELEILVKNYQKNFKKK